MIGLAFFTPLESHTARSGDDGCSFFQRTPLETFSNGVNAPSL